MQFTVSGERNGKVRHVTWTDGELSGDVPTVLWIRELARLYEGRPIGHGPFLPTQHDHLSSPYSAVALIQMVFPGRTTVEGQFPKIDLAPGEIM